MGISLHKIHVNPAAPLYDINVADVVCHKPNGAICFSQNTNSHQYVILSHIIFKNLSNYKWPYASLQQDKSQQPTLHTVLNILICQISIHVICTWGHMKRTSTTIIILTMKLIWKEASRMYGLQLQQKNCNVWRMYLLDVCTYTW